VEGDLGCTGFDMEGTCGGEGMGQGGMEGHMG